ncbi:MAG: DUF1674 domain-containing protein [Gammaproteobacteria bacterium]|nr:DUF1674 domain-containing protein [Gammaproteobacteria bacterium]
MGGSFWHNNFVPESPPQLPPSTGDARSAPAVPERFPVAPVTAPPETGGPPGPEPTRFGDWERGGRCIDF